MPRRRQTGCGRPIWFTNRSCILTSRPGVENTRIFLRAGLRLLPLVFNAMVKLSAIFIMPRSVPVKTNENKTRSIRARVKPAGITVSIVEDDVSVRGLLSEWVRSADGFECIGVHENAEVALVALPQEKPAVVLMDINMPGISGIECVRRLKPQMLDTQFMMLTVYEDPDHIFKALSSGASGYLLKRTPKAELLAAVKDLCAGGSPMSSNIARKIVQSFQRFNSGLPSGADNLSPREREVLELLARGHLYKEIADLLEISVPTVNTHIHRIYEKLHVRSRSQAVAKFTHFSA
jgi:DNA-binding NarL/FixJ family response regulator